MNAIWLLMLFGNILAGYRPFGTSYYTSIVHYEHEELAYIIKQQCRNVTGNDKAFQELVSFGNHTAVECIRQYVSNLGDSLDFLIEQENCQGLKTPCGQIEKAMDCIRPLVEKIKPCMYDEDSVKVVEQIVNLSPEELKMICENDGALFRELLDPRSQSCVTKVAKNIDQCSNWIGKEWTKKDLNDYSLKECSELTKMSDCYNSMILSDCDTTAMQKLFKMFYSNVRSMAPCKQLAKDVYLRSLWKINFASLDEDAV